MSKQCDFFILDPLDLSKIKELLLENEKIFVARGIHYFFVFF